MSDDNYFLISALHIAQSLAHQICKSNEESGHSLMPGSDWIDDIVVIITQDGKLSPDAGNAGDDVSNNFRVEILPSLLFHTTDDSSGRARKVYIHSVFSFMNYSQGGIGLPSWNQSN